MTAYQTSHPDMQFKITWHPFYLDPTVKATEDKRARYERKFGKARFQAMIPHMEMVGAGEGITFKYGGKIGNTRDSHRVIAEAGSKGQEVQDKTVNALFHAYFEVNEDISDREVLARIGAETGVFASKEEGIEFLKSDKRGKEVDNEVLLYQYGRGISGVPHFIIDGPSTLKFTTNGPDEAEIGGAQEPRVFEQVFAQLEKHKKDVDKVDGDICLPDGSNC